MELTSLRVEVIYALPDQQRLIEVKVPEGATVRHAIEASGLLARHAEIDLARANVGIFSRPCKLDDPVRDGDRVEIYRALIIDPKDARRERARSRR